MLTITQNRQMPSIMLHVEFIGKITSRKIDAEALLDSGSEGIIINSRFAKRNNLTLRPVPKPFPVRNVDGSENIMGWVRHYTIQKFPIHSQDSDSYHEEQAHFYVTDIGGHDIILGTDWLDEHNPEINWKERQMNLTRCPPTVN